MVLLFQEFEKHLPLSSKGQIKSKEEGGLDETAERKGSTELKLYVWVIKLCENHVILH